MFSHKKNLCLYLNILNSDISSSCCFDVYLKSCFMLVFFENFVGIRALTGCFIGHNQQQPAHFNSILILLRTLVTAGFLKLAPGDPPPVVH